MDNGSVYDILFHAAEHGIPSDVNELIARGIDIDVRDKSGRTPILVALVNRHPETAVNLITAAGANLNVADSDGFTPLMLAIKNNLNRVCKMLIDKGCNVTLQNNYNETALHVAVNTCERIISQHDGNNENPCDDPWIQQVTDRTMELLKLFISHGCDVNVRNTRNQIALHFTSRMPGCAKYLLEHGSNVNVEDTMGRTPLTVAIENGTVEVVELLLIHGSEPNLGRAVKFDLWFYPLDHLQFKILTLLLKFQWRCTFDKSQNVSQKYSNESSSTSFDNETRLYLVRLAYHTGSCSQANLFHLLNHSDFQNTWQSIEKIRKRLKDNCNIPMSLEHISRIVILKSLKPKKEINISKLIIPSVLKSFLLVSDIVHD